MKRPGIRIFVLIDALGWKYLEHREFLNDILPHRAPLQTVLGFSSGAIPTMLTGLPPAVTGHWNLFYHDPGGSPFRWLRYFQFLPDAVLEHRVTRKLVKELGRRVLGMGQLFECSVNPRLLPWFNYVEKKNIYDRGGVSGAPTIFDQLANKGIPHRVYSYHRMTDAQILQKAEGDIRAGAASFFFLYLCEMDMFLHMHCHEPEKIDARLQWYDRGLRQVFQVAKEVDSDSTMTVLSDHGMTLVQHHFDLTNEVDGLGFKMPGDYLAVYDSTMARFWFFNDRARQEIRNCLEGMYCGRILGDDELRRLGVFFADRRFGELIFLLRPAWILSKSDFNGKGWMPRGMHGYHPEDPYSDGIFLSSAEPPLLVQTIADAYLCMRSAVEWDTSFLKASGSR
jgi:hypothetical protein